MEVRDQVAVGPELPSRLVVDGESDLCGQSIRVIGVDRIRVASDRPSEVDSLAAVDAVGDDRSGAIPRSPNDGLVERPAAGDETVERVAVEG